MRKLRKNKKKAIDYKAYLYSEKWKKKRKKILKRDNFTCQDCGSKNHLQVHHLTYKNIGNERLNELITVCAHCHKKRHNLG